MSRAGQRPSGVLTPVMAFAAWISVVLILNITTNPLIALGAFGGVLVLVLRLRLYRLLIIALAAGLGMTIMLPGVAITDGSFTFIYAQSGWRWPSAPFEFAFAFATVLRIPAQILAIALLFLVSADQLLAAAGRISPRGALLAALAARLQPLLNRDLAQLRDELQSRGLRISKPASFWQRARATLVVYEAMLSGLLDRAFQTSASLQTRGYGASPVVTQGALDLSGSVGSRPEQRERGYERTFLLLVFLAVVGTIFGRLLGFIAAPSVQVFGGYNEPVNGLVVALAAALFLIGWWPAARLRRSAQNTVVRSDPESRVRAEVQPLLEQSLENIPLRDALPNQRDTVLRLADVSATYPQADLPALLPLTVELHAGELIAVTGASGSGKSTFLDAITGVAPFSTGGVRSGEIRLGQTVLRSVQDISGMVAAVFQQPEGQVLVGHVTEEIAFGLRQLAYPVERIERVIKRVLHQLDLMHLADRDCATLSGGELQRVILASALVLEPSVLILDEPTSQIDAVSEELFWRAVDRARFDENICVIAAEHRLDHLLSRCDRVLVFANGRLVNDLREDDFATHKDTLLANPFAGLKPVFLHPHATNRLAVRIDRLIPGATDKSTANTSALFRGINFSLPAGAVVTLEGSNGVGKSSLLRAIRGFGDQSAISVHVDGFRRDDVGGSAYQFAWLSQSVAPMLPGVTVNAAATETCARLGYDAGFARAALAGANLSDRLEHHPSQLSVGERQRLALVASTAHRPAVWLLDEPTRAMDKNARRWVAEYILAHANAGGVILLATHDSSLAAAVATHRLRLDKRSGVSMYVVNRSPAGDPLLETGVVDFDNADPSGVQP